MQTYIFLSTSLNALLQYEIPLLAYHMAYIVINHYVMNFTKELIFTEAFSTQMYDS